MPAMRNGFRHVVSFVALSSIGLVVPGCGRQTPFEPLVTSTRPGTDEVVAALHRGPALEDDECQDFVERLTDAIHSDENSELHGVVDWTSIFERATADVDAPDAARREFIAGAIGTWRDQAKWAGGIANELATGGSYELLRIHNVGQRRHALFRLLQPEMRGVSYHDYVLARRDDGVVMAVDIYVLPSGELLSDTVRRAFAGEHGADEQARAIEQLTSDVQAGRHQQALAGFDELPSAAKRDKTLLLLRLRAAQDVDDRAYAAALSDLERYHPEDPSIDMLSIDGYLLKKQYDLALRSVGRLEKTLGGDPYLNVLRANINFESGNLDAARRAAEAAVAESPKLEVGYWALVTVLLKQQDIAAALPLMARLEDEFGADLSSVEEQPLYKHLVSSPQYEAWRAERSSGDTTQNR
jgi:hypothetical protein